MRALAFQGGTALRFLYSIAGHSEDLDFALEHPERGYDLAAWLRQTRATFAAEGYDVAVSLSDKQTVHGAFLRFRGLLAELDPASQNGEVLAVKVEVDTRPPGGAVLETTVVRRHVPLQLQHHDRASLFAGKLHAIMQRPYAKGRDIYELLWYLTDGSSAELAVSNPHGVRRLNRVRSTWISCRHARPESEGRWCPRRPERPSWRASIA